MSKLTQILLAAIFLVCLLSACSTRTPTLDPGMVQTAIAQTAAANPTTTSTPLPTATATETPTATATPTVTPTPTATATPTDTPSPTPDLRVIDADPQNFMLKANDLPKEAKYYLPNSSWISPHRNSEIVSGWGVDKGREYLEKTGRVDGWVVTYKRGSNTVIAPEEIYDNPVLFRTAEGARLLLTKYSNCVNSESGYTPLKTDLIIGDMTNVCVWHKMQSSGENRVEILVEFSYRNVAHTVGGWGWEKEVEVDYIANVARILLAKLEAAPLSENVTFEP